MGEGNPLILATLHPTLKVVWQDGKPTSVEFSGPHMPSVEQLFSLCGMLNRLANQQLDQEEMQQMQAASQIAAVSQQLKRGH